MPIKKDASVDILLAKGFITKEQVATAKEDMKKTGLSLEKSLEKLGYITEKDIISTVAESMRIPYIDLQDYLIDQEVIRLIPEDLAKKHKVVPLFKIEDTLTVAMVNPRDIVALDDIRIRTKIPAIEPVLSTPKAIELAIDQYYGVSGGIGDIIKITDKMKVPIISAEDLQSTETIAKVAEEAPIIKLVNLIMMQAIKDKASDIHIEPEENLVRIRFRIDGILHETSTLPKNLQSVIASRIKILSKMDIAEMRKPQDGRIPLKMENKSFDIRVSSFPTIYGENIVLRILDKTSVILGLPDLGFSSSDLKEFDKIIRYPYGIILVTGPTGSGKTTTLYSALSTINSMEKNIITVEDPVEYELPLIRQTQVNPKAGLTFATGLRSILRQDPDIVMVGEIRDKETADIAIQASLTGHLVFSTLHTNDSASALTRLIDMGVEPFLISSSVIGILAQRLVRVICKDCKEKYTPGAEVIKDFGLKENTSFYRGKGCETCKSTGYQGRIAIFEFLRMTEDIKKMVVAKVSADEIKRKAAKEGMRTLRADGLDKARRGITTIEEIIRVTEEM
ncbi:MAG: type II secretion system ATPase GspE [Candidatus Omnitrophica bacterium]|nr:type II secretion system ATPase GspE [Candidatus Omnitrophota bacterium]